MKDQITAMMEALRLAGIEVEHFKHKRQSRDETLDALEAILYYPKVRSAMELLQPLTDSPPLVPAQEGPAHS